MNITGTFCNILVICVCVMARRLVIEQENPHELEVLVGLAMKIMILWMWSHVVWEIGIKILENLLPPSSGWKTEPTDSLKMFLPIYQIIQHLTQDDHNSKKIHSNIVICINDTVIPERWRLSTSCIDFTWQSVIYEIIMKIIIEII